VIGLLALNAQIGLPPLASIGRIELLLQIEDHRHPIHQRKQAVLGPVFTTTTALLSLTIPTNPQLILISPRVIRRLNPMKKRFLSLANESLVHGDEEDAADEMDRAPTMANPRQNLVQTMRIALRKTMIPATSSARTAEFHHGKKP
jgi:hypothetical protein